MKQKRGSKYNDTISPNNHSMNYIEYGIDEPLMNAFCSYVMSENTSVHKYGITTLSKIVKDINESMFDKNQRMLIKFKFLKVALEFRLEGLTNRDMLLSAINRKFDVSSISSDNNFLRELSNDEVVYIEKVLSSFMNNNYINSHIIEFKNILDEYQRGSYRDREVLLPRIRECMGSTLTQFRRNDMLKDSSMNIFRLSSMNDSIYDIHRYITSPFYNLITGMQGFNMMLGGGFQKGRVYMFFALSGEGKTTTLENIFYQVWKNNKGFKTKDPTKKPCIVYLTMENLVVELVSALFHIITKGKEMKMCSTPNEALEEFKKAQFYFSDNEIEILIRFKPVNSVDTSYMYTIVEELNDEGYECIAFFQDYLMRIRPSIVTNNTYEDLGTIANDFKTFAILNDCPVISASQLNREAARIIDESRGKNDPNLVKKIGRANASDSVNIERNIDGMFILVPEVSQMAERFMGIKMVKHRYDINCDITSIYQPYYPTSKIALVEDLYEPIAKYRTSLAINEEEMRSRFGIDNSINNVQNIASVIDVMQNSHKNSQIMMQQGLQPTVIPQYVEPPVPQDNREVSFSFSITDGKEVLQQVVFLYDDDGNTIDITPEEM